MRGVTTLIYEYTWDQNEERVLELKIADRSSDQSVTLTAEIDDRYRITSKLIGDTNPIVSDKTFTINDALYHALVSLGVLPPVDLPKWA